MEKKKKIVFRLVLNDAEHRKGVYQDRYGWLIDRWGNIYYIFRAFDELHKEHYFALEIPKFGTFTAPSVKELIDDVKLLTDGMIVIKNFE